MKYIRSIAAKGIIFDNENRLLLCYERGSWSIPGGTVENRESIHDACVREVYEETGLRVRVAKLLGISEGTSFRQETNVCNQWCTFFFLSEIEGSQELPKNWQDHDSNVVTESRFFTENEFMQIPNESRTHINKSLFVSFEEIKSFEAKFFETWMYNYE